MDTNQSETNGHTKIDIPESSPTDGNWRTIDSTILFDKEQCDLATCPIQDVYRILEYAPQGLTDDQVQERREKFGSNKIDIKERHPLIRFLLFMWNPLSWVMEIAAIVAIALSNGENRPPDWEDFLGIVMLLLINSIIGFVEESRAGNAVKALMAVLAPECRVKRNNGVWSTIPATELVPGDIISIKLGNVIPADARIISSLSTTVGVDQAALTGECFPVTKNIGDHIFSSTICKQGECEAIIIATGKNTFFGRAAAMVSSANDETGHLQKVLAKIGNFCIVGIALFVIAEIVVMYAIHRYSYRRGIDNILVLLIGGLPIAMPTVLSVTMAIGAKQLSEKKAIVTRITSIEELAAVSILCSDKTGTLTLNKLTIDKEGIVRYMNVTADDVLRYAAYACNREHTDAIDSCVLESFGDIDSIDRAIAVKSFIPFDSQNKRTQATYEDKATGSIHHATKGMPEIILDLCSKGQSPSLEQAIKMRDDVKEFARRGFRSLAVAVDLHGKGFQLLGLLPIFDPPRSDTAETIRKAMKLGVQVKMITGDQLEIAKETGRRLGMGDKMYIYQDIVELTSHESSTGPITDLNGMLLYADGFASVYPEHKYEIVKKLQDLDNMVAMTGDGVNDAPALARANVGVAVADACDAARSASAIVLTEPGLSVIIDAILGSRQIFARMTSYSIYTCSITIRILLSFALLVFIFQYDFPPFLVLIIALFNDGTMLTIAKDLVQPSEEPTRWRLGRIFISAIIYGFYLAGSTIVFYIILTRTTFLQTTFGVSSTAVAEGDTNSMYRLNSMIYLQVSIISQALIFITRSQGFFFTERPTILLVIAFIVAQLGCTFIAVYADWGFTKILGCGWDMAAIIWVYDAIWFLPLDFIKFSLQVAFNCSFSVVKPFKQCCGRKCSRKKKQQKNAVGPESEIPIPKPVPPQFIRQMSIRYTEIQQKQAEATVNVQNLPKKEKGILKRIDEFGELGANYYSPHMEVLSTLRRRQVILGRAYSH